jgi:hypothetical protein
MPKRMIKFREDFERNIVTDRQTEKQTDRHTEKGAELYCGVAVCLELSIWREKGNAFPRVFYTKLAHGRKVEGGGGIAEERHAPLG